jgi:hypothetical protein
MPETEDYAIPKSIKDKAINEDLILHDLIRLSVPFSNFYKSERGKMKRSLYWIDNTISSKELNFSLPRGHLARTFKCIDGSFLIVLRDYPVRDDDASTVAHELAHIVLDSEGFSFVETTPNFRGETVFEGIAFSLNNLLQDPLVIISLHSYGFDLKKEYFDECEEAIGTLKSVKIEPDGIRGIKFTIDYVKNLLENDQLHFYQYDPCKKYSILFEMIFPHIVSKAKELHHMINDANYRQISKSQAIYRMIIDYFRLSEFLQVIRP